MWGIKYKSKVKLLRFVLLAGVFALFGFYAFLTNSMSGDRFESEAMEQKITELKESNAALELAVSEAQSLTSLKVRSEIAGLEQSDDVHYIQVKGADSLVLNNK